MDGGERSETKKVRKVISTSVPTNFVQSQGKSKWAPTATRSYSYGESL